MLETILSILNFTGALFFLQNGNFIKTIYFKIALLFILAYPIGVVFKITHFVYANEILILSSLAILLFYVKYFTNKPIKNRLEYLKLAWVVCVFGIGLLRMLRLIHLDLHILPPVIMSFMILDYFRNEKSVS
ncbi:MULTISPECIES: hypothetical protein [unclassified Flavobacterium]|uniref:hypothetical protein n=1 Tax=unclassified Flavobacterium TaxID=196869 RepID=UPI00361B7377